MEEFKCHCQVKEPTVWISSVDASFEAARVQPLLSVQIVGSSRMREVAEGWREPREGPVGRRGPWFPVRPTAGLGPTTDCMSIRMAFSGRSDGGFMGVPSRSAEEATACSTGGPHCVDIGTPTMARRRGRFIGSARGVVCGRTAGTVCCYTSGSMGMGAYHCKEWCLQRSLQPFSFLPSYLAFITFFYLDTAIS